MARRRGDSHRATVASELLRANGQPGKFAAFDWVPDAPPEMLERRRSQQKGEFPWCCPCGQLSAQSVEEFSWLGGVVGGSLSH